MRIGIDIGGVIIGGGGQDTSFFSDNYLSTPAIRYALSSVRSLNKEHELFFISKCGPQVAQKTLDWLENRAFFWKAGVDPNRLVFCRERSQKAPIAQLLELDVFIDDRQDICQSMRQIGIRPILFTDWPQAMEELQTSN